MLAGDTRQDSMAKVVSELVRNILAQRGKGKPFSHLKLEEWRWAGILTTLHCLDNLEAIVQRLSALDNWRNIRDEIQTIITFKPELFVPFFEIVRARYKGQRENSTPQEGYTISEEFFNTIPLVLYQCIPDRSFEANILLQNLSIEIISHPITNFLGAQYDTHHGMVNDPEFASQFSSAIKGFFRDHSEQGAAVAGIILTHSFDDLQNLRCRTIIADLLVKEICYYLFCEMPLLGKAMAVRHRGQEWSHVAH